MQGGVRRWWEEELASSVCWCGRSCKQAVMAVVAAAPRATQPPPADLWSVAFGQQQQRRHGGCEERQEGSRDEPACVEGEGDGETWHKVGEGRAAPPGTIEMEMRRAPCMHSPGGAAAACDLRAACRNRQPPAMQLSRQTPNRPIEKTSRHTMIASTGTGLDPLPGWYSRM